MVASKKDTHPMANGKPATTVQGQENKMIALAYEVVEKKMLSGTASSQEVVHFLKLGTEREKLERQKLENENALAQARVEQIANSSQLEDLLNTALAAFRGYQPSSETDIEY